MIVVKIGGGGGDVAACCADVARLRRGRARGAGTRRLRGGNAAGRAAGPPPRFITTPSGMRSRYTDARTLEIFTMALAGAEHARS